MIGDLIILVAVGLGSLCIGYKAGAEYARYTYAPWLEKQKRLEEEQDKKEYERLKRKYEK